MAWNDGLTESLSSYLKSLEGLGEEAKAVAKSVIDDEASSFNDSVTKRVPVKTGGLKNSIKFKKTGRSDEWYGYTLEFEGNAPNGEPYEKIANIVNFGSKSQSGTHFVSNAIRKLKGMDDRIAARVEAEINKHAD